MAKKTREVIVRSYRLSGVISHHRPMSGREGAIGLEAMQGMLTRWSSNGLSVPSATERINTLTTGQAAYTWGTGGDFTTVSPVMLDSVFIRENGIDHPVTEMSRRDYARIASKSAPGRPDRFVFDPAYPLAKLTLYPQPDSNYTLHADAIEGIVQPALLTETVSFSADTAYALEYCLAVMLAPEFQLVAPPDVRAEARSAKRDLHRIAARARQGVQQYPAGMAGTRSCPGNFYGGY